jgi:hypothetical protein
VATTPHFAFYSDFASNLHDSLRTASFARHESGAELFASGAERACFDALPSPVRAGWMRAVDYYFDIEKPDQGGDRPSSLTRLQLAGVIDANGLSDPAEKQIVLVESGMRSAAAPAYEACRWPAQDAQNRRWIDSVTKLLSVHEAALGDRLEQLFGAKWAGLPFRVDVVDRANRTGATTLNTNPPGAHILVSSAERNNDGAAALEVVFHEASHFLTGRGMPLSATLNTAQHAVAGVRGDYTHQVHFFLTGEAVRQEYARVGDAQYAPLLFALRLFSDRFRSVVQKTWSPYMDGRASMADAANALMRELAAQGLDRRPEPRNRSAHARTTRATRLPAPAAQWTEANQPMAIARVKPESRSR